MSVDTETLREHASRLNAAEFAKELGGAPALIYNSTGEEAEDQTRFSTGGGGGARRAKAKKADRLRVLFVKKGERSPFSGRIFVGRSRSCDLVIRDSSVSKLHCYFVKLEDASYGVCDAESRNGVTVNGVKIGKEKPVTLKPGDAVIIGSVKTRFVDPALLYAKLRAG